MDHYLEEINLYFELKGTPASSKESYRRRMRAFIRFMQDRDKSMEELNEKDVSVKHILTDLY